MAVRVRYQTLEIKQHDIHIRSLRDNQQFADDEGVAEALGISSAMWPHFGQIWQSGRALARMMVDHPVGDRRTLEVGCGLGLASLVLNARGVDITATDRHPEASGFLASNVELNAGAAIPFERTSWLDTTDTLGRFDLIIGSDLLYEAGHPVELADFIERHAESACEVLLIDPGRSHFNRFGKAMIDRGFTAETHQADAELDGGEPYRGRVMRCLR